MRYFTWYEFKRDLQKEAGRSVLNQEWFRIKPKEPLPWNQSDFQNSLSNLSHPKNNIYTSGKLIGGHKKPLLLMVGH